MDKKVITYTRTGGVTDAADQLQYPNYIQSDTWDWIDVMRAIQDYHYTLGSSAMIKQLVIEPLGITAIVAEVDPKISSETLTHMEECLVREYQQAYADANGHACHLCKMDNGKFQVFAEGLPTTGCQYFDYQLPGLIANLARRGERVARQNQQ